MAVAHVDTQGTTSAGGASVAVNITVSGTNPVLIAHVGSNSPGNTFQYPTSITWSLGGSLTRKAEKRNTIDSLNAYATTWALAAPAAGAGTMTANFDIADGSRDCQVIAQIYSGADQTNPCPTADAVAVDTATNPFTITPANLASGDATSAICTNTAGAPTSAAPNQRWLNTSVTANVMIGDATNTTGVTFTGDGAVWRDNHASSAVRIVSATGATDAGVVHDLMYRVRLREF